MILRARIILPVGGPPIENGAIELSQGTIQKVGTWDAVYDTSGKVLDLGEVALFPGFVNAHCHLDYTSMAGKLAPPRLFPDWIKSILSLKAHYSYTDYAASWMLGARQLLENGTTTVADIEAVPELLAEVLPATPLKVFTFIEMTGVKNGRAGDEILREAMQRIETLPPVFRSRAGLSPHSPYSTYADLLRAAGAIARKQRLLATSHVSESKPEWEMFMDRAGPLFDWLKTQRRMDDCGGVTPLEHVDQQGLLNEQFLAVHANYLNAGDMNRLANRRASVVHCPRSHQYFGHASFPFEELHRRGINICLGTDSLASTLARGGGTLELSMFEEMRAFTSIHPEVDPVEIISMATSHGAKALGCEMKLGVIAPGAAADFAAIPFTGDSSAAAMAIVNHCGKASFSMIDGRCVFSLNGFD